MLLFVLFSCFNGLTVYLENTCLCTEIYTQSDCENFGCSFQLKLCVDLDCNDITSRVQCDTRMDCSYDQKYQACSQFSQCNAYYADSPEQCNNKGDSLQGCTSDGVQTTDGYYKCETYISPSIQYVQCDQLNSSNLCTGVQTNGKECVWKSISNECVAFQLNSCDDATDLNQSLCDTSSCIWENSDCNDRECSDFNTQTSCTYIPNLDGNKITICNWNSQKSICQELDGVSTLGESNCTTLTMGTYYWNNVELECIECQGYTNIINMIIILVLIFM